MNIEINLNVILKPSEELMSFITGLIHPMFQVTTVLDKVEKPMISTDPVKGTITLRSEEPSTTPPTEEAPSEEQPKKKTKAEAKAELNAAIESAKEIIPDKGGPAKGTTPPRTLDDIRTLCTNMAARQNFDVRKFLTEQGFKKMSDIPVEEWNDVYEAAKKEELF